MKKKLAAIALVTRLTIAVFTGCEYIDSKKRIIYEVNWCNDSAKGFDWLYFRKKVHVYTCVGKGR